MVKSKTGKKFANSSPCLLEYSKATLRTKLKFAESFNNIYLV